MQQMKLPSKKSWNLSHLKYHSGTFQRNTKTFRSGKAKNLTEPEAVKRLKSEMIKRGKKVAKKARLAPDLRERKLQVGKGPMLEMQSKL